MNFFLIRLDDAASNMNINNWLKMESLLDKYNIKPIVGVIPNNKDTKLLKYECYPLLWDKVRMWEQKGWTIALHGYDHVFITKEGGINPINKRSEFAGVELEKQKEKITKGIEMFNNEGIVPKVFFAPAHTFDENTLIALKDCSPIRIISDTIANDMYFKNGFYFLPQQSGKVRKLPFKLVTFCYHPNVMSNLDFKELDDFLNKNINLCTSVCKLKLNKRKLSLLDRIYKFIYFKIR